MLNDLYEFTKSHWGVFTIAAAWCVREWTTVRGWNGLKSWFLNGKLPPDNEIKN